MTEGKKVKVAGYVKLAKLWEKKRKEALQYQKRYYSEKYRDLSQFQLVDVFVDITGEKQIAKRKEMLRLLKQCMNGNVDCIAAQTKAYLAADTREFCYLIKLLSEINYGIELVTEDSDYHIDTIINAENQKEALCEMAEKYIALNPTDYDKWHQKIVEAIEKDVK